MYRNDVRRQLRSKLVGKEIFEITPVILGGDPADPKNKAFLTRSEHLQAVRYWNGILRKSGYFDAARRSSQT